MSSFILLLVAAGLAGCAGPEPPPTPVTFQPNVLFIAMDDLNDWIEPLGGHPQARTPNLNRLAAQGVTFTRAYCASPACNPSRAALMSGRHCYTTGVYSNYQDWREVITGHTALGKHFRDNGYHSAGAGKIYHYHMVDPSCWDDYWPSQTKNMPDEYLPQRVDDPDLPESALRTINMPEFENMYKMFDWAPLDIPDDMMSDYRSVEWVSARLQEKHDKPFFLACGIYRPHVPWYVPRRYFDMFPLESVRLPEVLDGDLDDVGDRVRDIAHRAGDYHRHVVEAGQWKQAVQGYLAAIAFADAMLGRLLDALARSPYADNTIVVLWSDHGWQLGEKEHWRKFALWENVVRSVLMIRVPPGARGLPGGAPAGAACDRVTSLMDIYPTLVELCGLPARTDLDGRSLVPLLRDPAREWPYPAVTTYDFGEFSVRDERWRYTVYIDGSEELYDHSEDPEEWRNLAGDPRFAAVKAELRAAIPENPAPLVKTSVRLEPHHTPPFRTRAEYLDWLRHGKSYPYIIRKYWQNDD
jgi:arylsulfatase A-like enzyme